MRNISELLAGRFIVIDGPDGVGKSTQIGLLDEYLRGHGADVVRVGDPGSTPVGDKIRHILLDRDNGEISPICETFLFMASRAQLVQGLVLPALKAGKTVLCDRFVSATLAYQGASGVDKDLVLTLARIAIADQWPHITIILDLPPATGMKRIGILRKRLKGESDDAQQQLPLFGDRMEIRTSLYHRRVTQVFKELHRYYPGKVRNVSATGTQQEVSDRILSALIDEFAPEPGKTK